MFSLYKYNPSSPSVTCVPLFIILVLATYLSTINGTNKTIDQTHNKISNITYTTGGTNRTSKEEDELHSLGNDPNGYKLIKEETVEEILDLDPELKLPSVDGYVSRSRRENYPHLSTDMLASESSTTAAMNDLTSGNYTNSQHLSVSREPKQIIRIDKPGEDGRTRIIVSANQVRDKLLLVSQQRNQLMRELSAAPGGDQMRVVRVPQRIIIAEGGIMPVVQPPATQKKPVLTLSIHSPAPIAKSNHIVPASHRQLARPDSTMCPKRGHITLEHPSDCDKYYYCEEGLISEQICPNGLVYGTQNTVLEYCVYRWEATCGDKSIPNPISSPGCRWQYGLFTIQGSPKCSPNYYECKAGKFETKKCALDDQVYDDLSKSCRDGKTIGCTTDAVTDFHCPPDDQANTYWPFPRYYLNDRALIHCINDKPQLVKCDGDERVDPDHLHCVPQVDRAKVNERIPEILEHGRNRIRVGAMIGS